jgi:gluconokinase
MTSDAAPPPSPTITLVVMGVTAAGKSVVMQALADRLAWPSADGDDFHPPGNVDKMRAGVALTDADRWPWLDAIADWIGRQEADGRSAVITCSALRRVYRDRLRVDHPSVRFAHLVTSRDRLADRLAERTDHFMPPALLDSQLEALEPLAADEPGGSFDADLSPDELAVAIVERLVGSNGPPSSPTTGSQMGPGAFSRS